MLLRPVRCAPMMLGGVGYQAGLDQAHRKQAEEQRQAAAQARERATPAPDIVTQLKDLKDLLDMGALSPDEFAMVKRKLLDELSAAAV